MNTALARGLISGLLGGAFALSAGLLYADANLTIFAAPINSSTAAAENAHGLCQFSGAEVTIVYSKTGSATTASPATQPTCTGGAWSVDTDVSGMPDGTLTLTATQIDSGLTYSSHISVPKDTVAPYVNSFVGNGTFSNDPITGDLVYNGDGDKSISASGYTFATSSPAFDFSSDADTLACHVDSATDDDCSSYFYYVPSVLSSGQHILHVTATDTAGNVTNSSITFCVNSCGSDTTAPVITVPANISAEAASSTGAVITYTAPTATDNVDGAVSVSCDHSPHTAFVIASTTVTCVAHDAAHNYATSTFTVTVRDTTPPSITVPATVTKEATATSTPVTFTAPTATDLVDGSVAVSCNHNAGESFTVGTTTVTCSATDAATNATSTSFLIVVRDTTAPAFVATHADMNATSTSASGAVVAYSAPAATDAVDTNPTILCLPASGSTFAVGDTTVGCAATDSYGNRSATSTFAVHVVGDIVSASPASGSYASAQSVTLSVNASEIRYTTDGTTPTCSSGHVYSSAIAISSDTTLKTVACYTGTGSSAMTYTYSIQIPAPVSSGGGNGPVVGGYGGGGGAPVALTATVPLVVSSLAPTSPVTNTAPAGTANGTPIVADATPAPASAHVAFNNVPEGSATVGSHVASAAPTPTQTTDTSNDTSVTLAQPTITSGPQKVTPDAPSQVATIEESLPGQQYLWMILVMLALLFLGAFLWDTYFSRRY